MTIGDAAGDGQRFDERQRRHEVTDAQRRAQHFAERADVDDAIGGVEPLERRQRPAGVAVFAVVVVFDDPRLALARPRQQLQPAGKAHRHAERILVRGRDVGGARLRRAATPSSTRSPSASMGIGARSGPPPGARCARRDSPDLRTTPVAGLEQGVRDEVHRLLRAVGDDDLDGVAADGARDAQVSGDGFTQRRVAERVGVAEIRRGRRPSTARATMRAQASTGKRSSAGTPARKARSGPPRASVTGAATKRRARGPRRGPVRGVAGGGERRGRSTVADPFGVVVTGRAARR